MGCVALVGLFLWGFSALKGCACNVSPEEMERRAAEVRRQQRDATAAAKAVADQEANQRIDDQIRAVKAKQMAEAQRLERRRTLYATLTGPERERSLRDACPVDIEEDEETAGLTIESAATEAERSRLTAIRRQLEAAHARKVAADEAKRKAEAAAARARGVCCCDGSVSPTCTTVHQGCCSHHGGVCGC